MKGKTVVITGGNDGIGFHTSLQLAKMGARIILLCRNQCKAEKARKKIVEQSGNCNVSFVIGDLSRQDSIRKAAGEINQTTDIIDVLINNAASVFGHFATSKDGNEMTIATNHLGGFLLTGLLLEKLKLSNDGRIINVSSHSHYRGKIDIRSFSEPCGYSLMKRYEQSKLANVMFTLELAERLKNKSITVNCLHPGKVKTDLGKKASDGKWTTSLLINSFRLFNFLFGISAEKGAETSIYLASSADVKGINGKYFSSCKIKKTNPIALDQNLRKQLFTVSEKLTGFSYKI